MATLEKIRSRSVLLLIIIGAALLAFIIGDFFTSSRTLFGTGTTIAKVGDQKIDVQEFQRRVQQESQKQQGRKYDSATLNQQVLNQMIAEALFKQEAKDLGLTVTDNELREMMVGKNSQYMDQMIQQQLGVESAAMAHDMAYNPSKYNLNQQQAMQLQQYWLELENNMEQMLMQQKFQNLFNGTLVANDLDKKAMYNENALTANVIMASKPYSSLDDEKYPVTDQELQDAYQKDRNKYKLDFDTRAVSYISVDIVPSAADLAKGQKAVDEALAALNEKEETTGLIGMDAFLVDRKKMTSSDLEKDKDMKAFADSVAVNQAKLVSKKGNEYTLAKLLGRPSEIDKATIDFLAVQGTREQVDSLVRTLNAGASFDSIATSPLVAQNQKDMEISLLDPQYQMVREMIEGATVGAFFTPDTLAENGRIFRVSKRDMPAPVYDMAVVSYVVEPSAATVNALQNKFQDYLNKNNDATKFTDNAQAAGYTAMPTLVNDNSAQVGNLPESHSGVAWAMENKTGKVSQIFGDEQSGKFYAIAVTDVYDDGFTPLRNEKVNQELTTKVRNDHKAAALIAQYKGKAKDVAGYAQLMSVKVDTAAVNFGQMMIPHLGFRESNVQGAVAAAKAGQLVGPIQGNQGVVVLQVNSIDKDQRPYNPEEAEMRFAQQRGAQRMGNNLTRILIGNNKIDNRMNRFYK